MTPSAILFYFISDGASIRNEQRGRLSKNHVGDDESNELINQDKHLSEKERVKKCHLQCILYKNVFDIWRCNWVKPASRFLSACKIMTRSILDNAVTTDSRYPFLRNFTSSTFVIGFPSLGLRQLGDGFLAGFPQLYGFAMTGNHIENIGPRVFENVSQLGFLALQSNKIKSLQRPFLHLSNLTQLYIKNESLEMINLTTFQGLNQLKFLTIEENKVWYIHNDAFHKMGSLVEITLRGNRLFSYATKGRFDYNPKLVVIDLSMNFISDIELPKTAKISSLGLNDNFIKEVTPNSFQGGRNLTKLHLQKNPITIIHANSFVFSNCLEEFIIGCCDNKMGNSGHIPCRISSWNVSNFNRIQAKAIFIAGCVEEINDRAFQYSFVAEGNSRKLIDGKHTLP